jgi:hypothetical protein
MSETYIARSKRHPTTGALLIANARLLIGDGSHVDFVDGEAELTQGQAQLLTQSGRDDITISQPVAFEVPVAAPEPQALPEPQPDQPPPAGPTGNPDTPDPATVPGDLSDLPQEVQDAVAHLREDGTPEEEIAAMIAEARAADAEPPVATTPFPLPDGFTALTGEGEPRCLATKADGTQCANPAKPGTHACQHTAHQAKVAAAG